MNKELQIIECPRDAMQGWKHQIPTHQKAAYINSLLKVGFDTLDFGSFVSPKAIPQMADTKDVIPLLDLSNTNTKLLAIIANIRGAEEAAHYEMIQYLGFPFSISETFQLRNTNKTIAQSLKQVEEIQNLCINRQKQMVVYISMGFGNPYGDEYNADIAIHWVNQLSQLGIKTIAMSDTVGIAKPDDISYVFENLIPEFNKINIGAHFHSRPDKWEEKITAAYNAGCRRFDTALKGIGGCPMAKDELIGNIATEQLIGWVNRQNLPLTINEDSFLESLFMAGQIFI